MDNDQQVKNRIKKEIAEYKELLANPRTSISRDSFKEGNIIAFGNYVQEDEKKSPLHWRVLAVKNNKALLITKNIIRSVWYDEDPFTDYISVKWTAWGRSSLHDWLNDEFISDAFTDKEKKAIMMTHIRAVQNRFSTMGPGPDTDDNVFILSVNEAEQYFKDDLDRVCIETFEGQYHKESKDERVKSIDDRSAGFWWLRNQGVHMCTSAVVFDSGEINEYGCEANIYVLGVRPAMWVDIDLVVALSPAGNGVEKELERIKKEQEHDKFSKMGEKIIGVQRKAIVMDRKRHLLAGPKNETFGPYSVGDEIEFGRYCQFFSMSNDPLDWIILDIHEGKALLITRDIIDNRSYVDEPGDTSDWEHSDIRKWLNTEFYETAFNEEEKKAILTTFNDDDMRCAFNDTSFAGYLQNDHDVITEDKVFLLALEETAEPGRTEPITSELLQDTSATMHAESNNEMSPFASILGWWLRTSCNYITHAAYACSSMFTPYDPEYGGYGEETYYGQAIKFYKMGVRPAIWVDTNKLDI